MGFNLFGKWYYLYANPTRHEILLEGEVAKLGERYRSQHLFPGLKHIADFVLLDRRVIIEVDGLSHNTPEQKKKDLLHTMGLIKLGWTVVRVTNDAVGANPARALHYALSLVDSSRQTTVEGLQAALDRLHLDYPALLSPPAKKPKRPRAPKAKSARPARAARSSAVAGEAESNPAPSRKKPASRKPRARPTPADASPEA